MHGVHFPSVSIHAPHMRRDIPRNPAVRVTGVSIHAPHMRRDHKLHTIWYNKGVSIHAPHMRRDDVSICGLRPCRSFNPRASHEARRHYVKVVR